MPLRLDDDARPRQRLRRNKAAALGLLLAMAGLLLATYAVSDPGLWALLLRATAEAGLVGGLADWFAVTALFRRPLGQPLGRVEGLDPCRDQVGGQEVLLDEPADTVPDPLLLGGHDAGVGDR